MNFEPLSIPGAWEITLAPRGDERGYFMRTYDETLFARHGLATRWVQENQSLSGEVGIVRGLHFQRGEHAETKLVRVLAGRVLDVIVDVRRDSPTFGKHVAVELSVARQNALYVPRGFAHGFCVLDAPAIVAYKVDNPYMPEAEGGLLWNDPVLGIEWPFVGAVTSAKDASWPGLAELVPVELPEA
ncbi:MAG: dTDP-4-dehydrorhamnose 3,5-epimerase [Verrucomicrobia bacterium]|nr:dTDP-4-dehydrorhamnose 3,5-epimerase [Verrucomicrobiota bacterium]